MPHLSRYHTLHVRVRGMRIWPPNAAKCCKNAGKFFPDDSIVNAIGGKYLRTLRRPNKGRKYNSNTSKDRNSRTKRLALLDRYPSIEPKV